MSRELSKTKDQSKEPSSKIQTTVPEKTDAIVKQIHFVNEKRDVGLQLSRGDLPSSDNNKSAQTRWTSTKSHPTGQHSKGRYLRTKEDTSNDDALITFYQPPPLYFNSDSDFLQMMTPANAKNVEDAKENRLSYLASIPIASFNDEFDGDEEEADENDTNVKQRQPKSKAGHNVRFNLSSSSSTLPPPVSDSQTKAIPKQKLLTKDFLQNFPLLRALVEEALTLQEQQQQGIFVSTQRTGLNERSHSAEQRRYEQSKQSLTRPKSATNMRPFRTKSVIVTKKTDNKRRLYPPPLDTRQNLVTKDDVRSLVDRLSKPKYNKRLERELALAKTITTAEETVITPRLPSKPTSVQVCYCYLTFSILL